MEKKMLGLPLWMRFYVAVFVVNLSTPIVDGKPVATHPTAPSPPYPPQMVNPNFPFPGYGMSISDAVKLLFRVIRDTIQRKLHLGPYRRPKYSAPVPGYSVPYASPPAPGYLPGRP